MAFYNRFNYYNFSGIDAGYRTYMPATINDLAILQKHLIDNMNVLIDNFNSNADYVNNGQDTINKLIAENKTLLQEINDLKNKIDSEWATPEELINEVAELKAKIDLFDKNNQDVLKQVTSISNAVEESKEINQAIQKQADSMHNIATNLQSEYDDVNSNINKFNQEYVEYEKKMDSVIDALNKMPDIEKDLENINKSLDDASTQYSEILKGVEDATTQLSDINNQYKDIEEALKEMPSADELIAIRDEINKAQQNINQQINDNQQTMTNYVQLAGIYTSEAQTYASQTSVNLEDVQRLHDEITNGNYNQDLTQLEKDTKIFTTIYPDLQALFTQVNGSIYDENGVKNVQTNPVNIVSDIASIKITQANIITTASAVQKDLTNFHKAYTQTISDINKKFDTKADISTIDTMESEISDIRKIADNAKEVATDAHDKAVNLENNQNNVILPAIKTNTGNITTNTNTINYNIKQRKTIENFWHLPINSEFYLTSENRCKVGMLRTRTGHYEILMHLTDNETIEVSGDFTTTTPQKPLQNNGKENIPILENSIPYDRNQKYIFYVTEHITNSDNSITTFIRKFTFITPYNDRNNIVDNSYSSPAIMYYENII